LIVAQQIVQDKQAFFRIRPADLIGTEGFRMGLTHVALLDFGSVVLMPGPMFPVTFSNGLESKPSGLEPIPPLVEIIVSPATEDVKDASREVDYSILRYKFRIQENL
jgi:hypothetical protein